MFKFFRTKKVENVHWTKLPQNRQKVMEISRAMQQGRKMKQRERELAVR